MCWSVRLQRARRHSGIEVEDALENAEQTDVKMECIEKRTYQNECL